MVDTLPEGMMGQYGQSLRKRGKFDRAVYYRRPKVDRGGDPMQHPGWITFGSRTQMEHFIGRGFEPLLEYGVIPANDPVLRDEDGQPAPLRSPWYPILAHPKGPSEFPLDQITTFRWYIPRECPNPEAKFPQLQGHKVTHYPCPECQRPPFIAVDELGGIVHLARHLRVSHDWDRISLLAYGDRVGIDFNVVYGDLKETFDFTFGEASEIVGCDECDYIPAEGKSAQKALRMHKLGAHKPMVVETVG
jgi:hypothetical protein